MVPGLAVVPCRSLRAVLAWRLPGEPSAGQPEIPAGAQHRRVRVSRPMSPAGLGAAPLVRLAAEASAAGGHHLCLTGPRDTGIPAPAAGLAALLPPLSPEDVLEVSAIHSVAGLLGPGRALITRPPVPTLLWAVFLPPSDLRRAMMVCHGCI